MNDFPDWVKRRTAAQLGPSLPTYEKAAPVKLIMPTVEVGRTAGRNRSDPIGWGPRQFAVQAGTEVVQVIPPGSFNRLWIASYPLVAPVGPVHMTTIFDIAPESRGADGRFTVTPDVVAYATSQFPNWVVEGFQGNISVLFELALGEYPFYFFFGTPISAVPIGTFNVGVVMFTVG